MSNDITPVSAAELKQFEEQAKEMAEAKPPAMFNHIRISYEDNETKGHFLLFKAGDINGTDIGDSFRGTIVGIYNQYIQFKDPEKGVEDSWKTTQFLAFTDPVNVYKNGVLHEENVHEIAKYRNQCFPESTYFANVYVDYKGDTYLLKVKGASCTAWFAYRKFMNGRLPWQVETNFGRTIEKNGIVTYYPMTFSQGKTYDEKTYQEKLGKAHAVSVLVRQLNHPSTENPNMTSEEKEKKEIEAIFS